MKAITCKDYLQSITMQDKVKEDQTYNDVKIDDVAKEEGESDGGQD